MINVAELEKDLERCPDPRAEFHDCLVLLARDVQRFLEADDPGIEHAMVDNMRARFAALSNLWDRTRGSIRF